MEQGGRHSSGFTIVETLIVLTVTSVLAVSAMLLVSGRQSKIEFQTSINNLQQQLQQIINETVSGYYPNNGTSFTCDGSHAPVAISAGSTEQGQNVDCIFLGKAIQFGTSSSSSALVVYPVAGNRLVSGVPVKTLTAAQPVVIALASLTQKLQYGLSIKSMNYTAIAGATGTAGAVGLFAGDTSGTISASDASGSTKPGSQQLSLYAINTTAVNADTVTTAVAAGGNLVAASKVAVCIASGSTDQSGEITIDSSLSVSLQIKAGTAC